MSNPYPANFADGAGNVRLSGKVTFTDPANQPGSGGSQPPIPFVQEAEPPLSTPGALWVNPGADPPTIHVQSFAGDSWIQVYPPEATTPTLTEVLAEGTDAGGNNIENVESLTANDVQAGQVGLGTTRAANLDELTATVGDLILAMKASGLMVPDA